MAESSLSLPTFPPLLSEGGGDFWGGVFDRIVGIDSVDEESADPGNQVGKQALQVLSSFSLLTDNLQAWRSVFCQQRTGQADNRVVGGEAENLKDIFLGDVFATEGDELIEHRLRIPHPALSTPRDRVGSEVVKLDLLFPGDMEEVLGDDSLGDAPEVKALASRDNGGEHLVCLGGGEDELHVRRRFLKRLEERVERRVTEHVNLVDVIDLKAPRGWGIGDSLTELTDLFDPVVGRAVDLEDVESAALGDLDAERVIGVEVDARSARAVERLGKDPGRRGLTGAARADEEVGMRQPILGDGVLEGFSDVVLTEKFREGAGAVFSGEDLVAHSAIS